MTGSQRCRTIAFAPEPEHGKNGDGAGLNKLGRLIRGRRAMRFCLVPKSWTVDDVLRSGVTCFSKRCRHFHVSRRELYGQILPDEFPGVLSVGFLGRGGLLARSLVSWLLFPRVVRARDPEPGQWAWLDSVRGEAWSRVYFSDLADGRLVLEAHRKRGRRGAK